jgi:hypothetical protein
LANQRVAFQRTPKGVKLVTPAVIFHLTGREFRRLECRAALTTNRLTFDYSDDGVTLVTPNVRFDLTDSELCRLSTFMASGGDASTATLRRRMEEQRAAIDA